jgi:DNA-binding HxlR family transcriptional regulator
VLPTSQEGHQKKRYSRTSVASARLDLLSANPGLATNVLADRLKRLERRGLISRARDPIDARQIVYKPTERAVAVIPMLLEMIVWSAKNGSDGVPKSLLRRYETDREDVIAELMRSVRSAAQSS